MNRSSHQILSSCLHRWMMPGIIVLAMMSAMTPSRAGLTINATAGDISSPAPDMVGGGNITTIFQQAVAYWEMVYPDPEQEWTLNLTYNWGIPGGGTIAQFILNEVDEDQHRILSGTITFDNTMAVPWFADPNPELMMGNPAFTEPLVVTNDKFQASRGPVDLNVGLFYVSEPDSPAYERKDLLTIAMHEIGHGLGLLYSPAPNVPVWEIPDPLRVTADISPYYAGMQIDVFQFEHLANPSLMENMTDFGRRVFPSSRDILTMAQISHYEDPNLNPYNIPGIPVPEPSSAVLLSLAGLPVFLRRRGKAKS